MQQFQALGTFGCQISRSFSLYSQYIGPFKTIFQLFGVVLLVYIHLTFGAVHWRSSSSRNREVFNGPTLVDALALEQQNTIWVRILLLIANRIS